MKNKIENPITCFIKQDCAQGETVEVMETILFTDIAKKEIKSSSFLAYADYMSFLAVENNIPIQISKTYMYGKQSELEKAEDLLIKCAMYN